MHSCSLTCNCCLFFLIVFVISNRSLSVRRSFAMFLFLFCLFFSAESRERRKSSHNENKQMSKRTIEIPAHKYEIKCMNAGAKTKIQFNKIKRLKRTWISRMKKKDERNKYTASKQNHSHSGNFVILSCGFFLKKRQISSYGKHVNKHWVKMFMYT